MLSRISAVQERNLTSRRPARGADCCTQDNPGYRGRTQPLRGVAGKIAENMAISLTDSDRDVAARRAGRVMDENRQLINQHRTLIGKSKVSYTHIIGWAILRALDEFRQ